MCVCVCVCVCVCGKILNSRNEGFLGRRGVKQKGIRGVDSRARGPQDRPYYISVFLAKQGWWYYKYNVLKQDYSEADAMMLTGKTLGASDDSAYW